MDKALLPAIVFPLEEHKATLIFLHGVGDSGNGWAQNFENFRFQHIKCVFPHAPIQPVTFYGGMKMPSWFDIYGLDFGTEEDETSLKEASQLLQSYIEEEEKYDIPRSRIFIGGFAQGGAVALYTAFVANKPVAGVVALSTWFPLYKCLEKGQSPQHNKNIPVLQCHGTRDSRVQFSLGCKSSQIIQSFNSRAEFKGYEDLMHSTCPEMLVDVKTFLKKHTA